MRPSMQKPRVTPFDVAEMLDCEAAIAAYLDDVRATNCPEEIERAEETVRQARMRNASVITKRPV